MARDLHSVLAKVQQGVELVIEQDDRPVAVLKQPPVGRMISEVLADLRVLGSQAYVDDDYAHDVEKGIESQRQAWKPPSWEWFSTLAY